MIVKEITNKWYFDSEHDLEVFETVVNSLGEKGFSYVMSYSLNQYLVKNGYSNLTFNGLDLLFDDEKEIPVSHKPEQAIATVPSTNVNFDELLTAVNTLNGLIKSGNISINSPNDNTNQSNTTFVNPVEVIASVGEVIEVDPESMVNKTPNSPSPGGIKKKKKRKGIDMNSLGKALGGMNNK